MRRELVNWKIYLKNLFRVQDREKNMENVKKWEKWLREMTFRRSSNINLTGVPGGERERE